MDFVTETLGNFLKRKMLKITIKSDYNNTRKIRKWLFTEFRKDIGWHDTFKDGERYEVFYFNSPESEIIARIKYPYIFINGISERT